MSRRSAALSGPARGARRRSSLRVRLTAGATLLAAATFTVGGLLVLILYHRDLVAGRENAAQASAAAIASTAKNQTMPRPIPMPVGPEIPRVQVLDSDNRVLTGDPASIAAAPMLVPRDPRVPEHATLSDPRFLPARRAYLTTLPVTTPQGQLAVVVAVPLDPADAKTRQAADEAAVALTVALAVVATVAWLVVGRALAPVEHMRTQVAAITAVGDLTQRLPVTAGRDEIGRLGHTLNDMLLVLQQADLRQRQFVADAAHELRTPLAGITAFLEVAVRHPHAIDREELAGQLLATHQRLNNLVNDLLILASMDANAPIRLRPTDLAEIVRSCLRDTRPSTLPIDAQIAESALVLGNESQLARVITNLLDNATRYAQQTVRITLATTAASAVVTVLDDGPGIPPDKQHQIWQRFVRLDEDRGRGSGGAGLGLALVKETVAAHGGTAQVTNAQHGHGALFTVRIPLANRADRETSGQ
jgi:signal transduction histidine kinase